MKKYTLLPLLLLPVIFFFLASKIQAQMISGYPAGSSFSPPQDIMLPRPIDKPAVNYFGQDHQYTVTFRGNGEAIVSGKFVFSNLSPLAQDEFTFTLPYFVSAKDILILQQVRQGYCLQYGYDSPPRTIPPPDSCSQFNTQYECDTAAVNHAVYNCNWYTCVNKCMLNTPLNDVCGPQVCTQYSDPDYFSYPGGNTEYYKLKYNYKDDKITAELKKPVKSQSSGSLLFYIRVKGYAAQNTFGAYDFKFETFKVDDKIRNLQVGITTDQDLYLRGTRGKTIYRGDEFSMVNLMPKGGMTEMKIASPQMDNIYNQIGSGTETRFASNLQPMESYSVKGSYADSNWKLYAREIVWGLLIALVVLFIVIKVTKFVFSYWKKSSVRAGMAAVKKSAATISDPGINLLLSVGLSFLSSVIIAICLIFMIFVNSILTGTYYAYDFGFVRMVLSLLISLIVMVIVLLAFFLPPIYMGKNKGVGWGILTMVLTVVWFIIYLVLLLLFFFFMTYPQRPIPGPIMPMLK